MTRRRHHSKTELASNFHRFWAARGGPQGFEQWRRTGKVPELLVRVIGRHNGQPFVAGFVIGDEVLRVYETAPILKRYLMGKTESEARAIIKQKGWTATIVRRI